MCDWITIAVIILLTLSMPLFFLFFYLPRFKSWKKDEFESKYGAPLEGLKKDKKSSLIYASYFVVRRVLFAVVTLTLWNNVILQLFLHWVLTTLAFAFIAIFDPFEDSLVGKLDMMNEAATVIIIDLLFIFTDNEPSARRQFQFGFVFIAVVVGTLCVHIYFLMSDALGKIFKKLRTTRLKRKMQTTVKALRERGIRGVGRKSSAGHTSRTNVSHTSNAENAKAVSFGEFQNYADSKKLHPAF